MKDAEHIQSLNSGLESMIDPIRELSQKIDRTLDRAEAVLGLMLSLSAGRNQQITEESTVSQSELEARIRGRGFLLNKTVERDQQTAAANARDMKQLLSMGVEVARRPLLPIGSERYWLN